MDGRFEDSRVEQPYCQDASALTTDGTPPSRRGSTPASSIKVANWVGHSVDVLLKIYAMCIDGAD